MNTRHKLKMAISNGEVVKIIYNGGSQPGTIREIAPIKMNKDKVRAKCFNSNTVKLFAINKISIVDSIKTASSTPEWKPIAKVIRHYESFGEFVEIEKGLLESLGWYIKSNDIDMSLYKLFKNRKPFKGSEISITYEEYKYDLIMDINGELSKSEKKSQRPWTLRFKNKDTKTFSNFDKAAKVFLEWANELAPNNSNNPRQ